jgi:tetratricopeptide (TPR) repeat protein
MSSESIAPAAHAASRWRQWVLAFSVLACAGIAALGWTWWTDARYRAAMEDIEADVFGGRYATACRKLETLLSWNRDSKGGIRYLLGSCELARGRADAAATAWAGVNPGSAFWEKAIRGRVRLLRESGQLAAAERLIIDEAGGSGSKHASLESLLVPIYADLGRFDEAARIIEDLWKRDDARGQGALEPAIRLLRQHIDTTLRLNSVDSVRATLTRAAKLAPDDDRVWLGLANLAIRTGDLDEAERRLDACQKRKPVDPEVWRARLRWAMASGKPEVVREALGQLTGDDPALEHRTNAWLAANRGDLPAERRSLESLLEVAPADVAALGRLASIAEKEGASARAAELRTRQTQIERLLERYLKLHDRNQPIRDATLMAGLAEQLGRPFEAMGFLTIAASEDPERADLKRDLARIKAQLAAPLAR